MVQRTLLMRVLLPIQSGAIVILGLVQSRHRLSHSEFSAWHFTLRSAEASKVSLMFFIICTLIIYESVLALLSYMLIFILMLIS